MNRTNDGRHLFSKNPWGANLTVRRNENQIEKGREGEGGMHTSPPLTNILELKLSE